MDFSWTAEDQEFRSRVQEFIREHWHGGSARGGDAAKQYVKALAENGWLTMAWPKEYGGRGAGATSSS